MSHSDPALLLDERRIALCARMLRMPPSAWRAVVCAYLDTPASGSRDPEARLSAITEVHRARDLRAAPIPSRLPEMDCPACGAPLVARLAARDGAGTGTLVLGRCGQCGHGALMAGAADAAIYASADYYDRAIAGGAGYEAYGAERDYRENKGRLLVERIRQLSPGQAKTLFEVGSGYGYTRKAAEDAGLQTAGLDVNPHAAEAARRLYGWDTGIGTLASTLTSNRVPVHAWDIVLYQFVLEHLADPAAELRRAASLLSEGGVIALLVPSVEALELEAFGASYRSLRSDHLHLFSRQSLSHLCDAAGLALLHDETGAGVHLLEGFLRPTELSQLDARGRGPDAFALAKLKP